MQSTRYTFRIIPRTKTGLLSLFTSHSTLMVEVPTKICARCETEFDVDEAYRVIHVTDHPHPEDAELGNRKDEQSYILCGPCATEFPVWLEPDVDSFEELYPSGPEVLFGEATEE